MDSLINLLGASWRTSSIGIVLIVLAIVLFMIDREEQAVVCFVTGIGFLKTRDSAVTSQQQAAQPGALNKAPDPPAAEVLQPTITQAVEKKVEELVVPKIQELEEKKADR
jgi:hypothetical protein